MAWISYAVEVALQVGLELPQREGHSLVNHNGIRQAVGHKDPVEGPVGRPRGGRGNCDGLQPLCARVVDQVDATHVASALLSSGALSGTGSLGAWFVSSMVAHEASWNSRHGQCVWS